MTKETLNIWTTAGVFISSIQCPVKRAESSPEHLRLNGRLQQENDHQQREEQERH